MISKRKSNSLVTQKLALCVENLQVSSMQVSWHGTRNSVPKLLFGLWRQESWRTDNESQTVSEFFFASGRTRSEIIISCRRLSKIHPYLKWWFWVEENFRPLKAGVFVKVYRYCTFYLLACSQLFASEPPAVFFGPEKYTDRFANHTSSIEIQQQRRLLYHTRKDSLKDNFQQSRKNVSLWNTYNEIECFSHKKR